MSVVGEEVSTETSEDFGFKKLGQATILPSYNEKLPYTSLQNLDISNEKCRYVATSGGKVVIGDLQSLREFIQNDENTEISFLWERELKDVMMVKFSVSEDVVIVCKDGSVYTVDQNSLNDPKNIYKFDKALSQAQLFQSSLLAITIDDQLFSYNLAQSSLSSSIADNLASFDIMDNELYLLLDDYSVQVKNLQNNHETIKKLSAPQELMDEFHDQYHPNIIKVLNKNQLLLVFGEKVSETDEDVMYDHKFFIVDHSADQPTFSESFDMTPAFGSVLRYPTSYNIRIQEPVPEYEVINVLASACSSEVTIWDSKEVIQPSQDSERAVLPISKTTDNDTNPIGVSLDVSTHGVITDPCPGVDKIDRLPLIYILNDEGNLQIVGLYHSSAIKSGNFSVPNVEEASSRTIEQKTSTTSISDKDSGSVSLSDLSLGSKKETTDVDEAKSTDNDNSSSGFEMQSSNKAESKPLFGSSVSDAPTSEVPNKKDDSAAQPFSIYGNKAAFGAPAFGTPAFGTPAFGASDAKPAFGQTSFGSSDTKSAFGAPAFGTLDSKSPFGAPSFGSSDSKPAFGTPSFGGSGFGALSFGSSDSKPTFGNPSFGGSDSKPAFGAPSFGSSDTKSAFGGPAFGSSDTKASFGAPSFESADSKPAFGTPSFGGSDSKPAFGAPSFGNLNSKPTFGKPAFGSSALSTIDKKVQNEQSPFANSTFSKFAGENPFTSKKNERSPFASLSGDEGEKQTSSPFKLDTTQSPFAKLEASKADTELFNLKSKLATASEQEFKSNDVTADEISATENEVESESEPDSHSGSEESDFQKNVQGESSAETATFEPKGKEIEHAMPSRKSTEAADDTQDNTNSDLSDSTIEQTPSVQVQPAKAGYSDSSISAITARIKAGAKVSSDDLKLNQFEEPKFTDQTRGNSPFSAFANNLDKASPSGFSFAKISAGNEGSEDSKPKEALTENRKGESLSESLTESAAEMEEESASDASGVSEEKSSAVDATPYADDKDSQRKEDREEEANESEQQRTGMTDEPEEFTSKEIQEAIASDVDGSQGGDVAPREDLIKTPNSESLEKADSAREESYDALDDVTQGELEAAMGGAQLVEDDDEQNTADKAVPTSDYKPQEKVVVTQGVQAPEVSDNACQTVSPASCDFEVQTFQNEESYVATQHKPKPVPSYFTGANITQLQYSSSDPIMKSIEKTYQVVSAEMSVLRENASKMNEFMVDQSTRYLENRSKKTISNIYTWRIPESEQLQAIITEETKPFVDKLQKIEKLQQDLAKLELNDTKPLKEELRKAKTEYYQCETLDCNPELGELKYHQLKMQHELRQKMSKLTEKFEHVEELLQILKLCTVENQRIQDNPYVSKLVKDSASRQNLLDEIVSLREEIHALNSTSRAVHAPEKSSTGYSVGKEEIQSAPVVELGLQLSTKQQLGEYLKKQRKIPGA